MAKMLSVSRMQARFNLVTSFRFALPAPTDDSISERFLLHFYVTIFRAVRRVSRHAAQHVHTQMHMRIHTHVCVHIQNPIVSHSASGLMSYGVLCKVSEQIVSNSEAAIAKIALPTFGFALNRMFSDSV